MVPVGIIVVDAELVKVSENVPSLHIVWACAGITGFGLTTTL